MTLPSSLVVTSLCSALLPALVLLKDDRPAFASMTRKAVGYSAFFLAPATWILFVGGNALVNLLFHSASVNQSTKLLTGDMLAAYSIGILAIAFKDVIGVVFIALGRAGVPMVAGAVILTVSVFSKAMLPISQHPVWIAFTTSFAMWAGVLVLIVILPVHRAVGWARFWAEDGRKLVLINCLFGGLCVMLRHYIQSASLVRPLIILFGISLGYVVFARMLHFSAVEGSLTRYPPWWKRSLDLAVAVPVLVVSLPVMALCAAAVRVVSGSPVLYRQPRTGLKERIFVIRKFRTLQNDTSRDGAPLTDAARLTPLGRLLRKTSLDELPQLWNVITRRDEPGRPTPVVARICSALFGVPAPPS